VDLIRHRTWVAAALDAGLEDWGLRPGADEGTPRQRGLRLLGGPDLLPEAGVWTCTPGSWPLKDLPYSEVVYVIEGRNVLTDEDGRSTELHAGDMLMLPRAWSGRWQIVETTRKVYFRS
jgi:uncharacterized cupin superfamily protein